MNKVIRDGKVAVLYSPGYGAGWSTWIAYEYGDEVLFDPGLVSLIESKSEYEKLEAYATLKWPNAYLGGLEQLTIMYIPQGTKFRVVEYDGNEIVEIQTNVPWKIA